MTSSHPGLINTEPTGRAWFERRVAWTREQLWLAREALTEAEQSHEDALAALADFKAGENQQG